MGNPDRQIRQQGLELVFHLFNGIDHIIDKEHLSAPVFFPHDSIADNTGIVFGDIGLDRETVRWRCFDNAHLAQIDQGHMERPGNRRRAQGQHVDVGGPGLPLFFLGHAKALLFIDDEQSQIFELHPFIKQAVGPDEDIDISRESPAQDILFLFL